MMNLLYRNTTTGELVKAGIKTIKGVLTAVFVNVETGKWLKVDEEEFKKSHRKISSPEELIPIEKILVKSYL